MYVLRCTEVNARDRGQIVTASFNLDDSFPLGSREYWKIVLVRRETDENVKWREVVEWKGTNRVVRFVCLFGVLLFFFFLNKILLKFHSFRLDYNT